MCEDAGAEVGAMPSGIENLLAIFSYVSRLDISSPCFSSVFPKLFGMVLTPKSWI